MGSNPTRAAKEYIMRMMSVVSPDARRELAIILNYHEHCKEVDIEISNDNGIGPAIKIHCSDCDREWDITDYSTW